MNSLLLLIYCTIVVILLHKNLVFATNLHDFINAIKDSTNSDTEEYSKEFTNKSLIIVVSNETPEKQFSTYDEDIERLINDPNLSDEILERKDPIESFGNEKLGLRVRRPTTTTSKHGLKRATISRSTSARERDHQRRVKEILEHINKHFTSAYYIYNETKRIETTRVVLDELRIMAIEVSQPKYERVREKIMKCAYVPPQKVPARVEGKTNNLVIDIVKDSINDGVPIR
uniref:Seminal fluid protein n=1 Tax=Heliothis virescens TaxID=7102 RepID=A0A2A4IXK4_HELVI